MRKFKFDPVIKVKETQEKRYKRELSQIKVIRENAEKILEELHSEKESCIEDSFGKEEKLKALDLQMSYAYLTALARQVEEQKDMIEKIAREEEKKRNLLIKTNQNKQMLEKLRKKFLEERLRELRKKEQTLLDSISHRSSTGR
jgi:flagellar export protein FliJ